MAIDATVSDDKQVKRVWAVIYPPSFQPPTSSAELVPESLRTVELHLASTNQADGGFYAQFSGILDNLTEAGQYRIAVYAEDEVGFITAPVLLTMNTTSNNQRYLPLIIR